MKVQINYRGIQKTDAIESHVVKQVEGSLGHLSDRLTRIEVHLSDENHERKTTDDDKRCLIEARPAGRQPIAVEARNRDLYDAVKSASDKLKTALSRRFEKADEVRASE